ncbi:hypothetical protein GCM10010210_07300 [Pseudonocardia hydrocarbonoxydans]
MARAAPPPTSEAETAIRVAQAAIDTANDQRCSQPRIRGLTSGGVAGRGATVPADTCRDYATAPVRRVSRG